MNSNSVEIEFKSKGAATVVGDSEKIAGSVKDIGENASGAIPGASALSNHMTLLSSAAVAGGIVAAGMAITRLTTDLYAVNKEFGQLNAQLVTITGSQARADVVFAQLEEFATRTPFQLNEVVTAFAKLKARGLDPSAAALTAYGDIASGMSKSLDQMIEAVGDAATGEFERLKEFGITASSEGDKVKFTFKGVSTTVAKEAGAIEGYLVQLGQTSFAGGMTRQMEELGGDASNLGDSWDALMRTLGDVGAVEVMKGGISGATTTISALTAALKEADAEMETTAEWMAAYSVGQVSFWEWMTTGADEARGKLRLLKDEMEGRAPGTMESSHDSSGASERIAKIKAQVDREEQARLDATKLARKKAQDEINATQKAMDLDAINAGVDAWIAGEKVIEQARAESSAQALEKSAAAAAQAQELGQQIRALDLELAGQEAQLFDAAVRRAEMVNQAAETGVITAQRQSDLLVQIEADYQTRVDEIRRTAAEKQVQDEVDKAQRLGEVWWSSAQNYIGFAQQMATFGAQYALADEQQRGDIARRMLATTIRFLTQSLAAYLFNKAKEKVFSAAAAAAQIAAMGTVATADMAIGAARAAAWAAFYAAHAANPIGAVIYGASAAAMTAAVAGFGVAGAASAGIAAAGVGANLSAAAGYAAAGIAVTALGEAAASKVEGTLSGDGQGVYGAGSPTSPVVTTSATTPQPSTVVTVNFHGYVDARDPADLARLISSELRKAEGDGY